MDEYRDVVEAKTGEGKQTLDPKLVAAQEELYELGLALQNAVTLNYENGVYEVYRPVPNRADRRAVSKNSRKKARRG